MSLDFWLKIYCKHFVLHIFRSQLSTSKSAAMNRQHCLGLVSAYVVGGYMGLTWNVQNVHSSGLSSSPPDRLEVTAPPIGTVRVQSNISEVDPPCTPALQKERFERDVPEEMPTEVMNRSRVHAHLATFSFQELWPAMQLWTMIGRTNAQFMWNAVEQINALGLEGDILEAGVWKGGATMAMVFANMKYNTERHFWLLDTFEGLPAPGKQDDARSHNKWKAIQKNAWKNPANNRGVEEGKWNYGPKDIVKNNLYWTGYPWEKFHFIQGKVEETLPKTDLPPKFAVLRLDTDWYESTKVELEYLWDRLVPGGLLYIDDFCTWGGSRKATKEFFQTRLHLDIEHSKGPCLNYWKQK